MEQKDFVKYLEILQERPFALYPAPQGPDQRINWRTKKFTYITDSPTHVAIQDTETQKNYELPLVLVEFANPGILRLSRTVAPWNGSFV